VAKLCGVRLSAVLGVVRCAVAADGDAGACAGSGSGGEYAKIRAERRTTRRLCGLFMR